MFGLFTPLTRSAFANLAALVAAGYVGGLILGPGADIPTWRYLVFLPVGMAAYLIVAVLFSGSDEGNPPKE